MSRRVRVALALAAALAAIPARAFVRTTDPRTGVALAWPLPAVAWHLNRHWPETAPSCQASATGDPTFAAVRASFSRWELPCTDLRLLYGGESSELRVGDAGAGGNVVVFRQGWCSQNPAIVDPTTHVIKDPCLVSPDGDCGGIYDCFDDGEACVGKASCSPTWGIVALTTVLYDPSSGRIYGADIEVNGWDGQPATIPDPAHPALPSHGWYFTCFPGATQPAVCAGGTSYGTGGCAYIDLQNTVTHEVGHLLGLAHPCTTDPSVATSAIPPCGAPTPPGEVPYLDRTMAPTTEPGSTSKRLLSADEVAGICAVYPPASGGCGCGGGAGAGALALLLAALGLRPRRTRGVTRR